MQSESTKFTSSCISVAEDTSGKTMVGTDESFTEARALKDKTSKYLGKISNERVKCP